MKNTSLRGSRGHGNECPLIELRSRRTGSFLLSFCRITKAWCAFFVRLSRGESFKLLQGCRASPVNLKGPRLHRTSSAVALGQKCGCGRPKGERSGRRACAARRGGVCRKRECRPSLRAKPEASGDTDATGRRRPEEPRKPDGRRRHQAAIAA